MQSVQYPLTIYYDASCPMCREEMDLIKSKDTHNQIILADCSAAGFETPASCPATREAMMDRIHAVDASGKWLKSTDVFAVAYATIGADKIAKFWGSKLLQPLFKVVYPMVADNRKWLSKTPFAAIVSWLLQRLLNR